MTVAELRALLSRLPDDMPVFIHSASGHGLCHITSVDRRQKRGDVPGSVHLDGTVSWMHGAPPVVKRGVWRRDPQPAVNVARARDELLSMLSN